MRVIFTGVIVCAILTLVTGAFAADSQQCTIIPVPQKVEFRDGAFKLLPEVKILADGVARETGAYLSAKLDRATGYKIEVAGAADTPPANCILLNLADDQGLGGEGYELTVEANQVTIRAAQPAGLFYGVQSLLQLFPPRVYSPTPATGVNWSVPCVHIQDQPRFPWRGLMLDTSRHFFTKEEVKRFLELMALHKFNTFHWHIVDHDGWRMEVKKYPKLTEIGAWRGGIGYGLDPRSSQAYGPDGQYGGFYTQDEIREIVRYAQALHITVVPEIELPGHAGAAVRSYPQLGCVTAEGQPARNIGVYCMGNDEVFSFLEDVLNEAMELFPGTFIHVGGDEVDKQNWEHCPKCQARMKAENLKNLDELQSYGIRRMDKFLTSKGRRLLGWTEIRQGGLASNAAIMDWIGGGAESAAEGHDVVMTPTGFCYYDYYQALDYTLQPSGIGGFVPLRHAYAFDPIPQGLAAEHHKHILGGQANLWTEFIASPRHLDLMTYPRACALSEVVWSPKAARNWDDFTRRLSAHLKRLDQLGVNYYAENARKAGEWPAAQSTAPETTWEWDITGAINREGKYHVVFDHTSGGVLKINWVALLDNGQEVARDTHAGVAAAVGTPNVPDQPYARDAVYILSLSAAQQGHQYKLRVHVAVEGKESKGDVLVNSAALPVPR